MASPADARIEVQGKHWLTKRMVWEKLAMSEDSLDRLRRADPSFPKFRKPAVGGLKMDSDELEAWMEK